MDTHERIAFVVDMLNSLNRPNENEITKAEYYEYKWQDLMNILIGLLMSLDPTFNQQLAAYDLENAIKEILRSLATINYEPGPEIRDRVLGSMMMEEALVSNEDVYTDILFYLLSNLEDWKETYYLSAYTSPIQINDPTLQLDTDIIKLLNDLDSCIIKFMDLRAHQNQLAQDLSSMRTIKRDLLIKEDKKNQLDNRLLDIRHKFSSDTKKRPDLFVLCQQIAQKEATKRKILALNEHHSNEIEHIREEIFTMQSEEQELKQLLAECEIITSPQELIEKLETDISSHQYQLAKIYKPDLDDMSRLLEEIVRIETQLAGVGNKKQPMAESELVKRIEEVEDQIDAGEKELKKLRSTLSADGSETTMSPEIGGTNSSNLAKEGESLDGQNLNMQIARLVRTKNDLMKEFQHLSSVYMELNEQLELVRQTNDIRLPKEFDNLAEFCDQPLDSHLEARRRKQEQCLLEKREMEAKILNLEQQIRINNDRYRETLDRIEKLERDNNILGYFTMKQQQERENNNKDKKNKNKDMEGMASEKANSSSNDGDYDDENCDNSITNDVDIVDVDVNDEGVIQWNGVDIDRLKEQIDEFKMEIERKKDSLNISNLENLRKEHKTCQARLKELREPYESTVVPIKNQLSKLESTKQELEGELDQLKNVIMSKERLIESLANVMARKSESGERETNLDIGSLNGSHLERQKKMWQTIESWLDCLGSEAHE